MAHIEERNRDATVHVSGLTDNVDEPLLWELMVQAGPVVNVYIPRDKLSKKHSNFGFVEFKSEYDAEYAIKIMNKVKLYGEELKVKKSSRDKAYDVGAKLFIGNLDLDVDEEHLYHTFSVFGLVINSKVMRDESNVSKGYAFLSFDTFEAADASIEAMNGQFLRGKRINVQYALKKDSKNERHGSEAERTLAQNNPMLEQRKNLQIPSQQFTPGYPPQMMYGMGYPPMPYPGFSGYSNFGQ